MHETLAVLKQILWADSELSSPTTQLEETTRRPCITWPNTIQRDLRAYNLILDEAVDMVQNHALCHALWRLMSMYGACQKRRRRTRRRRRRRTEPATLTTIQAQCALRVSHHQAIKTEFLHNFLISVNLHLPSYYSSHIHTATKTTLSVLKTLKEASDKVQLLTDEFGKL